MTVSCLSHPPMPLQVASSHVGMLVFGIFNSSVYNSELEEAGFSFDEASKTWVKTTTKSQRSAAVVKIGSYLRFRIRRLHHVQGLISIEGDNPQIGLNNAEINAMQDGEEGCVVPKSRKKKLRLM